MPHMREERKDRASSARRCVASRVDGKKFFGGGGEEEKANKYLRCTYN